MIVRFLQPSDDRSAFSCGDPDYDDFLRKHAGQNHFKHHIGKTLVVVDDERVVGYRRSRSVNSRSTSFPGGGGRAAHYPVPVLRLAQLAVDTRYQGVGLGRTLVGHVLVLALRVREEFGCVAVVVDALITRRSFYEEFGFKECDAAIGRPRVVGTVLMALPLKDVAAGREPEA